MKPRVGDREQAGRAWGRVPQEGGLLTPLQPATRHTVSKGWLTLIPSVLTKH